MNIKFLHYIINTKLIYKKIVGVNLNYSILLIDANYVGFSLFR